MVTDAATSMIPKDLPVRGGLYSIHIGGRAATWDATLTDLGFSVTSYMSNFDSFHVTFFR